MRNDLASDGGFENDAGVPLLLMDGLSELAWLPPGRSMCFRDVMLFRSLLFQCDGCRMCLFDVT